ncbi:hypothetical protein LTR85_012286 [Meristemomyces frigidus]|nr:hypothetical protein LTR85_012286 [Meristemomyces frigidus]
MAVVGLGGIGKTQVVLHLAYSVLEKHPDISVFWVPALSAEAFEKAYREIAKVLGIEVAADGKEDVKELVRRQLGARTGGKWLLVVDNADDMDILDGAGGEGGLLQYLPEGGLGRTIFTTRSSEVLQFLVGSNVVELGNMTRPEAVEVMGRSLIRKDMLRDEAITTELLIELDCLPLAVTQATAYMNRNKVFFQNTWISSKVPSKIWENLAENHPSRLASQHALAIAYQANGQVEEAVRLLEHVVAIRKRVQAEDHPNRRASQHAPTGAYQANRQVEEAVRLLEHVVAIHKRTLAKDHPSRLA